MARHLINARTLALDAYRYFGGADLYGARQFNIDQPSNRAFYTAPGASKYQARPAGTYPPVAWMLPIKAGGIASNNEIAGAGEITSGNLAGGLNAVAALAGSGDMTGTMQLVVSLVASLAGSCSVSADLVGALYATAALSGSGTMDAATLGAVADIVAAITASGSLSATPSAIGHMEADLTLAETLSPSNLAAAVWNALAASFTEPGSMGEAMGSGGSLTPTQAAYLVELWRIHGLDVSKPLVVTETSRKVPADGSEIDQTITDDGTTTTVTRT